MEILVSRFNVSDKSTISRISIDGVPECYGLEPPILPEGTKIYAHTAIPAGRYRLSIAFSPKHNRYMPLLLDVPNFAGVEHHIGNTPLDTEGCTLIGGSVGVNQVLGSALAFGNYFNKISVQTGFDGTKNCPVFVLRDENTWCTYINDCEEARDRYKVPSVSDSSV